MTTAEQRQAWRELAEAATPGEWEAQTYMGCGILGGPRGIDDFVVRIDIDKPRRENVAFIAAARTAVPALLADVDRLTAERDALAAKVEQLQARVEVRTESGDEASLHWQRAYAKEAAERDALAAELAQVRAQLEQERGLMNMVPEYIRYLAAWRAGDGVFLVFNEWVEQRIMQPAR